MDVAGRKVTKERLVGFRIGQNFSAPTIPQTPNTLYKGLRCADSTPVSKHPGSYRVTLCPLQPEWSNTRVGATD